MKALFFIFLFFTLSSCLQRNDKGLPTSPNPLDHRDVTKDPVTENDKYQAKVYKCESEGNVWLLPQKVCVTPQVACQGLQGHYFDHDKDICVSPEDLCMARRDGSEWHAGKCLSAAKACELRIDGARWIAGECIHTQVACERQGYHWYWDAQGNRCRVKDFMTMCQDQKAPYSVRKTIVVLQNYTGREMGCNETWRHISSQSSFALVSRAQDENEKGDFEAPRITDAYPLASFTNLIELRLDGQYISDFAPITFLRYLKKLSLSQSEKIKDISSIDLLKDLEELNLSYNSIESIDALESLSNLRKVDLRGNQISFLKSLSELNKLEDINFSDNPIKTIYFLKNLGNLKSVRFYNTPIRDTEVKKQTNCPTGPDVAQALDRFCSRRLEY